MRAVPRQTNVCFPVLGNTSAPWASDLTIDAEKTAVLPPKCRVHLIPSGETAIRAGELSTRILLHGRRDSDNRSHKMPALRRSRGGALSSDTARRFFAGMKPQRRGMEIRRRESIPADLLPGWMAPAPAISSQLGRSTLETSNLRLLPMPLRTRYEPACKLSEQATSLLVVLEHVVAGARGA